jgi:putative heme-binding domain-containing protein
MEAVVSAAYVQSPDAVAVAMLALDRPRDRFIDYALTQTVRALKPQWYPALVRGELRLEGRPDHFRFVLEADGTRDVAGHVRRLAAADGLNEAARNHLLALLADVGRPEDLLYALDRGRRSALVLHALAGAAPPALTKGATADGLIGPLNAVLADQDAAVRAAGVRLAGAWRVQPLAAAIRDQLQHRDAPAAVVREALGALAAIEGRAAVPVLTPYASDGQPHTVSAAAVAALGQVDRNLAAKCAGRLMTRAGDEARMGDLMLPLLARKGGSEALARALAAVKLPSDRAKLARRVLSGAGRADPALLDTLNRTIGLSGGKVPYSPELVKQLAMEARVRGNARRGRDVFASKLANCTACHRIDGRGGEVGPDLSSVGTGLTTELIVESVLWPNRQVKEGYQATRVLTADGRILTGYKVKETSHDVHLRDPATHRVVRIGRKDIEEMDAIGSLMPEGLTADMTRAELRDLVRFLSELGRQPRN